MTLSPFLERRARALSAIEHHQPLVVRKFAGVEVKPVTNGSQGVTYQGRKRRRGKQRKAKQFGTGVGAALGIRELLAKHGPLVVRLVRVAPKALDGDNLEAALKRVRDGIAQAIGVDDRQDTVEYVADMQRGAVREHAVVVEVYAQRLLWKVPSAEELRSLLTVNASPVPIEPMGQFTVIGGRQVRVTPNVRRSP